MEGSFGLSSCQNFVAVNRIKTGLDNFGCNSFHTIAIAITHVSITDRYCHLDKIGLWTH